MEQRLDALMTTTEDESFHTDLQLIVQSVLRMCNPDWNKALNWASGQPHSE